jgi:hypothetical protein
MTVCDVPLAEWPAFLESFSREHRAWISTVHGLVGGVPITHIPAVGLKAVTLDADSCGPLLRITFINGISLCAAQPCVLRVQRDDGAERALEVETADGGFIRLAFRAAALPEQLDGVAPGELIAEALA